MKRFFDSFFKGGGGGDYVGELIPPDDVEKK